MELGEKLRCARTEAGLSQRQLCEGIVTRNMLSQIENGSAKPSMRTLTLMAERLGKNVSYFLEEAAVLSVNQQVMDKARGGYDAGDFAAAVAALADYRKPDPVYDREYALLWNLSHMALARQQLALGKTVYAKELLGKAQAESGYCAQALNRQRLLLLGQLGERVSSRLPSLDEELLLRAEEAETPERAEALLEAVENRGIDRWHFLRGRAYLARKQYAQARNHLQMAEKSYPKETVPLLEICCRELGDYKQAYYYAVRQK